VGASSGFEPCGLLLEFPLPGVPVELKFIGKFSFSFVISNQISYDQYFKQPRIYEGHGLAGLKVIPIDNSEKTRIKT
jgi:hypothetical protein